MIFNLMNDYYYRYNINLLIEHNLLLENIQLI